MKYNLTTVSPAVHFRTYLPKNIIEQFVNELNDLPFPTDSLNSAVLANGTVNQNIRNCKVKALPTFYWFSGFLWHYIDRVNREQFHYDLTCVENEAMSYIEYDEGDFYRWHIDHDINDMLAFDVPHNRNMNIGQEKAILEGEVVRKLSFSLQLSDSTEYEGGELQLLRYGAEKELSMFTVPKELGLLTIFDSRIAHRVRKVKSGKRKSLVGWVVGPRWR
jgi:PKHD-type hydroxylase